MAKRAFDKLTGRDLGEVIEERDNSYEVRDDSGEILSYFKEDLSIRTVEDPAPVFFKNSSPGTYAAPAGRRRQNTGLAVMFGLIPGMGQFYNGQNTKGLIVLLLGFIFGPFAVVGGMIDAALDAGKINRGQLPAPNTRTGVFLAIFAVLSAPFVLAIIALAMFFFAMAGAI